MKAYSVKQCWAGVCNPENRMDILSYYFSDVHLEGAHISMLCPFHADEKTGNFKYTLHNDLWKCFSCGEGGKGILSLMMKYFEKESTLLPSSCDPKNGCVLRISCDMGWITEEQFAAFSHEKYEPELLEKQEVKKIPESISPEASPAVIDNAYRLMQSVCGLSKKHEKHLLRDRQLEKEDLKAYFTFPNRTTSFGMAQGIPLDLPGAMYKKAAEILAKRKYGKKPYELTRSEKEELSKIPYLQHFYEDLSHVPGFYLVNEHTTRSGRHIPAHVEYVKYKGIGIMSFDADGRCTGVEVRLDDNPQYAALRPYEAVEDIETAYDQGLIRKADCRRYKELYEERERNPRYVRFSSSSVSDKAHRTGGAKASGQGGIIYPKHPGKAAIVITEGRFKAEKIAEKGNIAIYVTGVSNWKGICPLVEAVRGFRNTVYIAFDADNLGNTGVHHQLVQMADYLEGIGLFPKVILWSKEGGRCKGFDDLCIVHGERYVKHLKVVPFRGTPLSYASVYKRTRTGLLKEYGYPEDLKGMDRKQIRLFHKDLQEKLEISFALTGMICLAE